MQDFIIRDENGVSKGEISGHLAASLMSQLNGHWRSRTLKGGKPHNVFEVDEDCRYTVENHYGSLVMFLWKKEILVPKHLDN